MKKIGTVSYNIYCNFTNYGSALQTWALHRAISKLGYNPVLVDYCPRVLEDKDPLNPIANMWDRDEESKRMCRLSMEDIRINYGKFKSFYNDRFICTDRKYNADNFDEIQHEEIAGFVCGSDTIFCIDEFGGFDDGYYANYREMKQRSVSYAASFGDAGFDEMKLKTLKEKLNNFKALGIRENRMIPYVRKLSLVPVERTIDPTLLLSVNDYDELIPECQVNEAYLLLYARRYDPEMEAYAIRIAKEKGIRIVEISLRAVNAEKGHIMRYDAGVEEFLFLIKNAEYVVTNSYHGMIFSVQFCKQFEVFSREQCDNKIKELLELLGLGNRSVGQQRNLYKEINFDKIHEKIAIERQSSMDFLKLELNLL